uniref:Rhomboid family intramembrane serine protease n=1 Tax=Ignisphaera aggregans TaxID=334771 RepID=A0A7C5TG26_9CREN
MIWWNKKKKPWVTYILVALNVIIYLVTSSQNLFYSTTQDWIDTLAYVPVLLQYPDQWYRIITSMFTHGDIFHIFFNMWFLYMFGKEMEIVLGSIKFLTLYITAGVSAIIFHTGFIPLGGPLNLIIPAVGASGAISGILGAYLMLFPRRRLSMCYLFIIPLCFTTVASAFLLFWFALQVIYGYLRFGSVAFFAHVGGFVAGIAMIYVLSRRKYARETAYDFGLFKVFSVWVERVGLGRITKIILAMLLLAVMAGGIYSGIIAPNLRGAYVVDIKVWNRDRGSYSEDQAVYAPLTGDRIAPSRDDPRVIFNRLYWSGLLKGPPETSKIISDAKLIKSEQGVPINIMVNGVAEYDSNGILIYFNGRIITDVLKISPIWNVVVGVERNIVYDVNISSKDLAGETGKYVVTPLSYLSSAITVFALYIAVNKDKEIVAEESIFHIPPLVPGPI